MKALVIGHPDAVLGFSLAGVSGKPATDAAQAEQALDAALKSKEVGVILVTQDIAAMLPAKMEHLRLRSTIPLVVEIPSPTGTEGQSSLSEVVLKAIGIKL